MCSDATDVHPAGAVLNEHQDIKSLQQRGVHVQEIDGEDAGRLGMQELPPAGFQNSATGADLGFYAARSYSLMRPPRTGRHWIRAWERSGMG
jgi:hypothetical protein